MTIVRTMHQQGETSVLPALKTVVIQILFGDDGTPIADPPMATVYRGEEIIWCTPTGEDRPFTIHFLSAEVVEQTSRAILRVDAECSTVPVVRSLSGSLPSAPVQASRVAIADDAQEADHAYEVRLPMPPAPGADPPLPSERFVITVAGTVRPPKK